MSVRNANYAVGRAATRHGAKRILHRLGGWLCPLALTLAVLLPCRQAAAGTASAQTAAGKTVVGQVLSPENKAVENTEVFLRNQHTGKTVKAKTNAEGNFKFAGVSPGAYGLSVQYSSDAPFSRQIVVDGGQYAGLRLSIRIGSKPSTGKHIKEWPEDFKVSDMLPTATASAKASAQSPKIAAETTPDVRANAVHADVAGTNSGASFQIYSYVQNHNPPHVGFNFSDGHGISENEALTNGGSEPYDARASLTATQNGDSGGNTFIAVTDSKGAGGTDLDQSVLTGFFNGATAYTYRYGNGTWSLLRQDTVQNYTVGTPGDTNPADFSITYSQSGPQTLQGDVIWLDLDNQFGQVRGNDYYDRGPNPADPGSTAPQYPTLCLDWSTFGAGALNGCWELYNNLPAPYNVVTDVPTPSPSQITAGQGYTDAGSIEIVDNNTEVQGIFNYDGYDTCNDDMETPVPGHTYEVGVWLKGSTTDGVVTATYTQFNISKQFTGVNNTWQYFTWDFTYPGQACLPANYPAVSFQLTYNAPGTLEINGLHTFDKTYPPFQIIPPVLQAFQDFQPGVMRFWSNQSSSAGKYNFWSLDSWLTPEWQNRVSPQIGNYYEYDVITEHLPDALALAKAVGTTPWLIVNMSLTGQEWANLYDYLAAPVNTPGYASKRPSNHLGPYTDDFNTIYLEVGNEEWGTQVVPVNVQYGGWANYVTTSATANKSLHFAEQHQVHRQHRPAYSDLRLERHQNHTPGVGGGYLQLHSRRQRRFPIRRRALLPERAVGGPASQQAADRCHRYPAAARRAGRLQL